MLDVLEGLVRQYAGNAVINNPAVPNSQNDSVMQTVAGSILNGLGQQAQGGGLGDLIGMLTGRGQQDIGNSQVTTGVQDNVQQSLIEKLGISPQVAMGIAAAVVPMVLRKLMTKAADPNDSSVDANEVLNQTTGQQGIDWMGAAGSAMADGRLDMNDLARVLGQQSGGGLGGMLGSLLGGR